MFTTRPSSALPTGTWRSLPVVLASSPSQPRVVAEQNCADFSFFEVQRKTEDSVRKFDHLVEHDVAQAFDARDAVAGFADDADVAFGGRGF